jgi:hypothetical protein
MHEYSLNGNNATTTATATAEQQRAFSASAVI